jgi:hypothetical protein
MISRALLPCLLINGLLMASSVEGAIMLTLNPGTSNLTNLTVGDTVTVTVDLSALSGMQLASLGGGITFPAANFGTPQNSVAGSIIPDPSDVILQQLPGLMDSQFFAFAGGNIVSEGAFFSFQLTALAAGSGTIAFDPLSLFAEDDQLNPIFDIVTNDLQFTIWSANPSIVPEPASLVVWSLCCIALTIALFRQKGCCRKKRG